MSNQVAILAFDIAVFALTVLCATLLAVTKAIDSETATGLFSAAIAYAGRAGVSHVLDSGTK